ncbi:replicative DNA helicase Mcm [Methanococcus maripaludis]|uniref:Replicative DNA helicase Mcm n=1 Tax=Methanococcus maripaludis TaxID=39152 RepID=A0A7J9S6K7_METMI|nr:minichromosome maintenance protein MCM [Methanococcus maripaludis]MBB6402422.1 replicative DNA helicase Mcm [Methanococcus maripaludis]
MDDKWIQNIRPRLTEYLKVFYIDDIISKKREITIDLDNVYKTELIEVMEFLEEFPNDGIELLEECYNDAYYSMNCEKPDVIITVKNIPEEFQCNLELQDLKSIHIGKLVEFDGKIKNAKKIVSGIKKLGLICTSCGEIRIKNIDNPFETSLENSCPRCAQNMYLLNDESKYVDYQEITLNPINKEFNSKSELILEQYVILENSPGIYSGVVKIIGIPYRKQNKKTGVFDIMVKGIYVEKIEDEK